MNHPVTAKINANGAATSTRRPLRFVFFGESIVSDWGNPVATTVRAVMRALVRSGYEAQFLEERRNRPTVALLEARGSSALRAFTQRYSDLTYRTYDLPRGLERAVWFVRQVATADAVVMLDGAPAGIFAEAARLDAPHLTRISWSATGGASSAPWADLRLSPEGTDAPPGTIICGPAVERALPDVAARRSGIVLVAYDDEASAVAARETLAEFTPECLSAGSVAGAGWSFVPEVELPDRYRRARVAVVTGAGGDPFAAARMLLPVAAGCPVVGTREATERPERITSLLTADPALPAAELPSRFDAMTTARCLVDTVEQVRLVRHS